MEQFASIDDVISLWRKMTPEEIDRCTALIPIVCDSLREAADQVGMNLDEMIEQKPYLKNVAKSVTVDVVARTLMTSTNSEPMTQTSESALGYSWSGSYLVPGGGLFIKESEKARLGLKRQRIGGINLWGSKEQQ